MLLVSKFTVAEDEVADFTTHAGRALELLTRQPGCLRGVLARSADEAQRWVMTVEFDSVVAYRRALSPFEVRTTVVPLLSRADSDPAGYEVLADAREGVVRRRTSVVAADAETVRLGEASGPATPRD